MNSWNSASHKLPQIGQRVLVVVKNKYYRIVTVAQYVPKHAILAEDFLGDDCDDDFYDIGDDEKEYAPEGWYECPIEPAESFMIDGKVQYWMKIPPFPYM